LGLAPYEDAACCGRSFGFAQDDKVECLELQDKCLRMTTSLSSRP